MSLSTGDRLGPYEIYGLIGKGGMGEVYRARDTRLERTVAIKVLPAEFSVQQERLRRFEQEAQVLGALSHPNLLAIYDVGAQDGTHFLVSELLEGESLRQRLEEGALPLRKSMELGVQIAKGLAAAHEKGIVHRDIKPDNIFLTRDGRAKILDFGLAKQSGAEGSGENATITAVVTQPGVVLGTAGYMSPEQVRGKAADARSDIFSFGAILYEMVAGLRAFHGDSSVETMNAILKQDPPAISGDVPPAIERVIRRCLEKAPEERFQSARDLAFALEALSAPSSTTSTREAAIPSQEKRRWPAMLLLSVAALAIGAGGVFAAFKLRTPITPSFHQLIFGRGFIETARFTPDGQNVVYGASWNGKPFEIFTTGLDGLESRNLGLPPANILGIGANGQMAVSLGMHHTQIWMTSGTLAQVSLTGGAPRPVLENICDGDMSPDGKRMAIVRCSGSEETLEFPSGTVLFRTTGYIDNVRVSRAGDAIAFAEHPILGDDRGFLTLVDLEGNSRPLPKARRLTTEWSSLRGLAWSPSGKEVWFTGSRNTEPQSLLAVDLQGTLRTILSAPAYLWLQDISASGKVLLADSQEGGGIAVHSAQGAVDQLIDVSSESSEVDGISSDGTKLSVTYSGANSGVDYSTYFARNDGSPPVRVGDGSGIGITPDGKQILTAMASATNHLRVYPTGPGDAREIDISPVHVLEWRGSWPSDGSAMAFTGAENGKPPRIYMLDLAAGKVRPVTPEGVTNPVLSPDGRSLIARNAEHKFILYPLDGGAARPVMGLEANETPVQFGASGKLYTWNGAFPAHIMMVDLASGERQPAATLTPADPAGVLYGEVLATPDGKAFAYRYRRAVTNLFLAEGLK